MCGLPAMVAAWPSTVRAPIHPLVVELAPALLCSSTRLGTSIGGVGSAVGGGLKAVKALKMQALTCVHEWNARK